MPEKTNGDRDHRSRLQHDLRLTTAFDFSFNGHRQSRVHAGLRFMNDRKAKKKMIRAFLIGNLCGVIMAAALTFAVAIPANNDHWRIEITKRGGGDWCFDKNGKLGWMWTAQLLPEPARPAKVPRSRPKPDSSRERL
jgi:hypothetical protein